MRFAYFVACLSLTADNALIANGQTASALMPDFQWLFWLLATGWLAIGLYAFVWRPR